jgi:hypothetical protein
LPEEKAMTTPLQNAVLPNADPLHAHFTWRSYLATSMRIGRIAVQEGQQALLRRLLDDAFRFENQLLCVTGRTFCQISAAADADRTALRQAVRRKYRGED